MVWESLTASRIKMSEEMKTTKTHFIHGPEKCPVMMSQITAELTSRLFEYIKRRVLKVSSLLRVFVDKRPTSTARRSSCGPT